MQNLFINYLEQLQIGRKQTYKNLVLYPLLSEYAAALDYFTLDEAMAQDAIDVVEIDIDGSVPELKVINKSDRMILILEGEELVGARQNRIVNTTILIAPNATTVIPVSCVEEGRWTYTSKKFGSENRLMLSGMRSFLSNSVSMSISQDRGFESDQHAIWGQIRQKASRLNVTSDSKAMAEIYKKKSSDVGRYLEKFKTVDNQIGAVFLINGKVVGMDCFGKAETFSKTFKKLTESYALDAIDMEETDKKYKVSRNDAKNLLKTAASGRLVSHASVGLGTDCRLESRRLTGCALTHKEQILHMSLFSRD